MIWEIFRETELKWFIHLKELGNKHTDRHPIALKEEYIFLSTYLFDKHFCIIVCRVLDRR